MVDFSRLQPLLDLVAPSFERLLGGQRHCLVATSGGSDSLALLLLAKLWADQTSDLCVEAVVVDHGLRVRSAREAYHVMAFAASLGLSSRVLRLHGLPRDARVQAAAREARYASLARAARAAGACVVLGHTFDDQAETVFMRFAHGSGLHGLRGMDERRLIDDVLFLRPLLDVQRQVLRDALSACGVSWLDDPSNMDRRFERVRARDVLAWLQSEGLPKERFVRLASRCAYAQEALDVWADQVILQCGDISLPWSWERVCWLAYPFALRVQLLRRLFLRHAKEGQPDLSQLEGVCAKIEDLFVGRFSSQVWSLTLGGLLIRATAEGFVVDVAPPRRHVS